MTRPGYTLIELLVGLALAAVAASAVTGLVVATSRSTTRIIAAADRDEQVLAAWKGLERLLAQGHRGRPFSGDAGGMRFAIVETGYPATPGVYDLVVAPNAVTRSGAAGAAATAALFPEAARVDFAYAGQDGVWRDAWPAERGWPVLVRAEVSALGGPPWPAMVTAGPGGPPPPAGRGEGAR